MTTTIKDAMLADLSIRERGLRDQLKEIKALRAALKGVGENEDSNDLTSPMFAKSSNLTFKDMIVAVLTERGKGAQATEILELIKQKFGKEIKRSSISPQLSRLKSEGVILLNDTVWHLPEHQIVPDVIPHQVIGRQGQSGATETALMGAATESILKQERANIQQHAPLDDWRERYREKHRE